MRCSAGDTHTLLSIRPFPEEANADSNDALDFFVGLCSSNKRVVRSFRSKLRNFDTSFVATRARLCLGICFWYEILKIGFLARG